MSEKIFADFAKKVSQRFSWPRSGKLVLAISGGPDSIYLALIMKEVSLMYSFKLYIVHVDHCLRGKDSLEDSVFVRNFAERHRIPCRVVRINIPKIMNEEKGSSQEICRKYRLAYLNKEANRIKAFGVAFGHNKDDQAETVLINLIRGSGLNGLTGMKEFEDNEQISIYRPILSVPRDEIEKYLKLIKQDFRVDKSNLSDDYLRNHIRHNLIPYIEKEYNPNIMETLFKTSKIVSKDNEFLNNYTEDIFNKHFTVEEGFIKVRAVDIARYSQAIKSRVLRHAYEKLIGNLEMISFNHSNDMIGVVESGHGFSIDLPKNVVIRRVYDEIWMYKDGYFRNSELVDSIIKFNEPTQFGDTKIIVTRSKSKDLDYQKEYLFDMKDLKLPLLLRTKKDGDRFSPFGLDGTKKVKDFFIDEKIPQQVRDNIPLLVDGEGNILAIIGLRRSNKAVINNQTKDIVKCEILEVPSWKKI